MLNAIIPRSFLFNLVLYFFDNAIQQYPIKKGYCEIEREV